MLALDLACGQFPAPGFVGVDLWDGADVQCDLARFPWPWPDATVDEVRCIHYVEHVVDLVGFMNEVWRICKPDARVFIAHPYEKSSRAWRDPTHVRALNEESWLYYNAEQRREWGVDHYNIVADFEVERVNFILAPDIKQATMEQIQRLYGIVDDLHVTLRTIK